MYRKYFSISHLCLFGRQLFQQGEKGIHIYTGFQILGKMYVMLILHMVEIYATCFSAKEKRTYFLLRDEVYK